MFHRSPSSTLSCSIKKSTYVCQNLNDFINEYELSGQIKGMFMQHEIPFLVLLNWDVNADVKYALGMTEDVAMNNSSAFESWKYKSGFSLFFYPEDKKRFHHAIEDQRRLRREQGISYEICASSFLIEENFEAQPARNMEEFIARYGLVQETEKKQCESEAVIIPTYFYPPEYLRKLDRLLSYRHFQDFSQHLSKSSSYGLIFYLWLCVCNEKKLLAAPKQYQAQLNQTIAIITNLTNQSLEPINAILAEYMIGKKEVEEESKTSISVQRLR